MVIDNRKYTEIHNIVKRFTSDPFYIRDDGVVDVNGDVSLSRMHETATELPVTFGHVRGHFDCVDAPITSLKGSPRIVDGYFSCVRTRITSLVGGPRIVEGFYKCSDTLLTNLIWAPEKTKEFTCIRTPTLVSLEGAPKEVNGDFYCWNSGITSLRHSPEIITGEFCTDNEDSMGLLTIIKKQWSKVFLWGIPDSLYPILYKYNGATGTGKSVLAFASELIAAGYAGNAHFD